MFLKDRFILKLCHEYVILKAGGGTNEKRIKHERKCTHDNK